MGLLVQGATSRATTRCPVTLTSATLERRSTPTFLNRLIADLEELGLQAVHRAPERSFSVVSSNSGMVVSGKPDVIAVYPDGRTVIYDAQTGYQSASHIVQVQIYMYLSAQIKLGLACGTWAGAWTWTKDSKARSSIKDGRHVDIPADSIDDAFVARLADFHAEDDLGHATAQGAKWTGVSLVPSSPSATAPTGTLT